MTLPATRRDRWTRLRQWWAAQTVWVMLPATVIAVTAVAVTGPLADVDCYWHVLMGVDIVTHHRVSGNPAWTFAPVHTGWVTTQWGAEVIMAGLHHLFGWGGMTVLRVGAAVATLAVVAWATLRGPGGTRPRAVVFAVAGFAVAVDIQERPAALSYALLAVCGWWAAQVVTARRWPRPRVVAPLVVVWANLHGYWMLAPVVFGLLGVLTAAEMAARRPRPPARAVVAATRRAAALVAVTAPAGFATPAGWYLYQAPARIWHAAAPFVAEWAPTSVHSGSAVAFFVLLAVTAAGWAAATGRDRPTVSEVGWILAWAGFGLVAYRDVTPAVLLCAPMVAHRLAAVWPDRGLPASRATRVVIGLVLLAGLGGGAARWALAPRLPGWTPLSAYRILAAEPGRRRVLDYYNLGGQVLALTRPGVAVAVDGRTDLYGRRYLSRYFGLLRTDPGWTATLARLRPTDALLPVGTPLGAALRACGWQPTDRTRRFVLFRRPGTANRGTRRDRHQTGLPPVSRRGTARQEEPSTPVASGARCGTTGA